MDMRKNDLHRKVLDRMVVGLRPPKELQEPKVVCHEVRKKKPFSPL